MLIAGDSNGRVYPERLFEVVGTYAAYVLADSAFARLDHGSGEQHIACTCATYALHTHTHHLDTMFTGVLQLKDLPALMSEARADAEARDDEVSFVLGSVAHTRNGDMLTDDDVSDAVSVDVSTRGGGELTRAELLPALARIQLDDRDVGTTPGTVEELSGGEQDSDEADGLRSIVRAPLARSSPRAPPPTTVPKSLRACSAPQPLGPGQERAPAAWVPKSCF